MHSRWLNDETFPPPAPVIMAYMWKLPPKGVLFQATGLWRVGSYLLEVYERVGKSVISVCKKAQKGLQMHFMAVKKSRKRSGFVIYSCLKYSEFTAI